ncbi:neuroligin-4, X-linked-like [Mercenaria mercenaria]|uniref:neuroligin-4, X-linked-like n=1 Tax=Mercenaria mercenaria TaxID=6596 RepID=UPI00234F3DD1|nr:neuroligin-4, X-linked-like [Mercenaria mercenaria]XP_053397692.1 neuroligin-4, X-linked-like [Mercenaria mercenaria]
MLNECKLKPSKFHIKMEWLEFLYFLVATVILIPGVECSEINLTFKLGSITGISETVEFNGGMKNVTRFLGIPYAKPPTGEKRFQRPEPYGDYSLPYNATFFRPHCMQSETANPSVKYFKMSEDCLHLNVFIPGNILPTEKKYAVMIFLHGGAFFYSGAEAFSGDQLSAFNEVVLVTVNYRLNTFGFLSNGTIASGNMGLWDQKLAINWVHENIAEFAGDPGNVTLFGNSAGAASVLYQTLNPTNKGLFQRIITQSGNVLAQWAQQYNPKEMFAEFVSEVKCNTQQYDDILKCLQSKTAEELVTTRFSPVVDGDFITEDPSVTFSKVSVDSSSSLSLLTEVDFLSGVQSKEGATTVDRLAESFKAFGVDIANGVSRNIFENQFLSSMLLQMYGGVVPRALVQSVIQQYIDWSRPEDTKMIRDNMIDFWSDVAFFVPAINTIKKHQALGKPGKTSYFYVFDHKPPFDRTPLWLEGAKHAMELPYVFGMPDSLKIAAGFPPNFPLAIPPFDLTLSSNIMKMWTNFAKTGNPNSPVQIDAGVPQWPQYDIDSQTYLEFSSNTTSVKNHFAASKVEFWTNLVPLLEKCETCVDQNCTENQKTSLAHSISKNISLNFIYLLFIELMLTHVRIFV